MTLFGDHQVQASLARAGSQDPRILAQALVAAQGFGTLVGSSVAAVTASYLAACRRSLGHGPSRVATPAEFVLVDEADQSGPTWLISGNGEDADILAALDRAVAMTSADIHVLTSRADSRLAVQAGEAGALVHFADCGEPGAGVAPICQLAAAITRLLAASDVAAGGRGENLGSRLLDSLATAVDAQARGRVPSALGEVGADDVILVLHDPQLVSAAIAIETIAWHALRPVRRTDFRNFAHGAHIWAEQRPEKLVVLALSSIDTHAMWSEVETVLPPTVRRLELNGGGCGRFEIARSIIAAMAMLDAIGIRPAGPASSDIGRALSASPALSQSVGQLPPALRAKRRAVHRYDLEHAARDLHVSHAKVRARWAEAPISGIVLDYDGTMVPIEDRDALVHPDLAAALEALIAQGLKVGVATGRDAVAGERLRKVLSSERHADIIVGYYNGALIRTLDVDIRDEERTHAPDIANLLAWLLEARLFPMESIKDSLLQLTVPRAKIADIGTFEAALRDAGHLDLRVVQSMHTIDICLASTSKTAVVDALAARWHLDVDQILRVGDSGGPLGNDHALLGSEMGISVGELCGRPLHGWPLFAPPIIGPDALLRLLRAFRPRHDIGFEIAFDALGDR